MKYKQKKNTSKKRAVLRKKELEEVKLPSLFPFHAVPLFVVMMVRQVREKAAICHLPQRKKSHKRALSTG